MSDFFEPPPPPPPRPRVPRHPRPWLAAPWGTLPGIVALELVLAQTARFAVGISHLAAYPTGFACDAFAFVAPGEVGVVDDPMMLGPPLHHVRRGGSELSEDMLRLGVQFSDGRKATNLDGFPLEPDEPADPPVMQIGGASGGGGHWHLSAWVWPLPPPGPIAFVCEWPVAGIALTRRELDAQVILDAAARAQVIYANES